MTITSGGVERSYLRYVPKNSASNGAAAPLVLDFPAYSPAEMETAFSGFTKPDADGKVLADEVGAVVITTADRFVPFDGGIGSGPAKLGLSSETSATPGLGVLA